MLEEPASDAENASQGLRGRKKALRRREILSCAKRLFARQGVEASTIAEMAEMAGVSPPTVFNYFGSKENILQALLFEGTEKKRARHLKQSAKTGCPFATILHDLFFEISEKTMQIAGKRVWRFAESTSIRRPESEMRQKLSFSDSELLKLIMTIFNGYDIVLRCKGDVDPAVVARLFYDRWSARFDEFIMDDTMSLDAHSEALRDDMKIMVALLFDDEFAAHSPLKKTEAA